MKGRWAPAPLRASERAETLTFLRTSDARASASNATGSSDCLHWPSVAPTGRIPVPAHPFSLVQ